MPSARGTTNRAVDTTVPRVAIDWRPAVLGRSGIPRAVRELARALAPRDDVELRLFAHSWARRRVAVEPPAGARCHRLPIPGRSLPWLARCGLGAERLCGRPAVFHWTDYVYPPVGHDVRVVLTLHDVAFAVDAGWHGASGSRELDRRVRRALARADAVVCPTQATADLAHRHLALPAGRISVIPFGADHVARSETAADRMGPLLMVGTIEPRKNHLRLLAAWQALAAPRPELVVVGTHGWECDEIVAALEAERRRGRGMRWLEQVDDRQLEELFATARGLVYPSLLEGFGFPPLEALARGLPVLAGDQPAARETLGDAALFADPLDVEALRDGLQALLDASHDPASREARRAHAARYRWTDCARAHATLYRRLAGEAATR